MPSHLAPDCCSTQDFTSATASNWNEKKLPSCDSGLGTGIGNNNTSSGMETSKLSIFSPALSSTILHDQPGGLPHLSAPHALPKFRLDANLFSLPDEPVMNNTTFASPAHQTPTQSVIEKVSALNISIGHNLIILNYNYFCIFPVLSYYELFLQVFMSFLTVSKIKGHNNCSRD